MMSRISKIMLYLTADLFAIPIIITLAGSFFANGAPAFTEYEELFTKTEFSRHFMLTFIYSVYSAVSSVVIALPVAFLFAKGRFRFCRVMFFLYILVMMLPFQATMLPQYIILRDLGLLNTPAAFVIYTVFSPISVFLLRQFIVSLPDEVLQSALLDTDSVFRVMIHIVLPMIKPAIAVTLIYNFFESWNMYEQALTFSAQNREILPLSAIMCRLPEEVTPAASVSYMLPAVVLVLALKKFYRRAEKR